MEGSASAVTKATRDSATPVGLLAEWFPATWPDMSLSVLFLKALKKIYA